jgi:hypothetical protein
MKASSDALFVHLLEDLSPHLCKEAYIALSFKQDIAIWSDISVKEFAAISIAKSLLKKFVPSVSDRNDADNRAFEKFVAVNKRCQNWVLSCETTWDEILVGEFKRSLDDFLHPDGMPLFGSLEELFEGSRVGPGSSRMARASDFYTKLFDSPLTGTSDILNLAYQRLARRSVSYCEAEETRSHRYGAMRIVRDGNLCFVPKTVDVSRSICVEPTLNTFFQLGLADVLNGRLRQVYGIDFSTQQFKNRELARIGSLTNGLVTIDLSSASDSISRRMVKEMMPPWFVSWLNLLRTPTARYRQELLELHMVSTMGNGFTFPLQTMIFSSIVSAAFRARGIKPLHPRGSHVGTWGVFGDDIICPTEIAKDVLRLLHLLGFQHNVDKTFIEGPFRESCGHDYFRGTNVRGVYVKNLERDSLYAVINQLVAFGARTGVYLPRTVAYLRQFCGNLLVPYSENDDAGIKVPRFLLPKERYAKGLFGSLMYRRASRRPISLQVGECSIRAPKGDRLRYYNAAGLLQALLHGSLRSGKITIRNDSGRYTSKLGITPFWDGVDPSGRIMPETEWQRWKTSAAYNLTGL